MAACAALACVTLGGCSVKDEANKWFDQILCDHEYDEGEVTKEATCANKGEITYTCEECGKTKTEKTDKLPHVEKEIEVAATCQETGLTEGVKCVVCEEILVYPKVVAKIAHTEIITSAELAATCTTAGQTKGSHCGVCDEVLSVSEGVPALGHVDNDSNDLCDVCGIANILEVTPAVGEYVLGKTYRIYPAGSFSGSSVYPFQAELYLDVKMNDGSRKTLYVTVCGENFSTGNQSGFVFEDSFGDGYRDVTFKPGAYDASDGDGNKLIFTIDETTTISSQPPAEVTEYRGCVYRLEKNF